MDIMSNSYFSYTYKKNVLRFGMPFATDTSYSSSISFLSLIHVLFEDNKNSMKHLLRAEAIDSELVFTCSFSETFDYIFNIKRERCYKENYEGK
jgi:uncharacterized membrane protein